MPTYPLIRHNLSGCATFPASGEGYNMVFIAARHFAARLYFFTREAMRSCRSMTSAITLRVVSAAGCGVLFCTVVLIGC